MSAGGAATGRSFKCSVDNPNAVEAMLVILRTQTTDDVCVLQTVRRHSWCQLEEQQQA